MSIKLEFWWLRDQLLPMYSLGMNWEERGNKDAMTFFLYSSLLRYVLVLLLVVEPDMWSRKGEDENFGPKRRWALSCSKRLGEGGTGVKIEERSWHFCPLGPIPHSKSAGKFGKVGELGTSKSPATGILCCLLSQRWFKRQHVQDDGKKFVSRCLFRDSLPRSSARRKSER